MNTKPILIVEDDIKLNKLMMMLLSKDGYDTIQCYSGMGALESLVKIPKLIILDLMLPDIEGIELLKKIREKTNVPVIIVSAKDEDIDLAIALNIGADDYIKKPYSSVELKARVKAQLRRATQYNEDVFKISNKARIQKGNLILDLEQYSIIKDDIKIDLTNKEFRVLEVLFSNPGKVFTKEQLYDYIWGQDDFISDNTIVALIKRIREKIEDTPKNPKYIKTIWGFGYKLGDF